jgi:NAD(P)-dependent dehydrogenase (short-subunit alcohol dehydrogenase family)
LTWHSLVRISVPAVRNMADSRGRGVPTLQRFVDKVVIVTGAADGIGRATALEFAAEGARVVVADQNARRGAETTRDILAVGGQARFIEVDVADEVSVNSMVQQTLSDYGRLDIAFNNAGINRSGPAVADVSVTDFDRVVAVNLRGVFLCMKYEIAAMLQTGGGAIVNTASVGGHIAAPGTAAYNASKHGVVGLTRSAAIEYAARGIRVNAVSPGATRTPMLENWMQDPAIVDYLRQQHPIGRFAEPREIARVVLFLASEDASFVVGHPLLVDGGLVCI